MSGWLCCPRSFDRLRTNGGSVRWFGLLSVAHGVPSYRALAGNGFLVCFVCCRNAHKRSGTSRYRVSQQAGMPAAGLGGRRPLQDRAKVGGGWGRVLAESWVMRLVMLPRSFDRLRTNGGWVGFGGWWHFDRLRANGGCVSVVWFAFCRARGALLHGQCHKLTVWPGTGRYRLSQQAGMPAVGLVEH